MVGKAIDLITDTLEEKEIRIFVQNIFKNFIRVLDLRQYLTSIYIRG